MVFSQNLNADVWIELALAGAASERRRFALAGPAPEVAGRLSELVGLGLDRIIVVPGSLDDDPALVQRTIADFAAAVL
jgi:hypothetical protein